MCWTRTLSFASDVSQETLFERLNTEAAEIKGPSGLLAMDWWNGCRTPLMDAGLQGMIRGLTLSTTPAQIYRALVEATAYGTRLVMDTLEPAVGEIHELRLTGGLSRIPFIAQLYADVLEREVLVGSPNASARGAAVWGGMAGGGDVPQVHRMSHFVPTGRLYSDTYPAYVQAVKGERDARN